VRMGMGVFPDGTTDLTMYDSAGKDRRLVMRVTEDNEPGLYMCGSAGKLRLRVSVEEDGTPGLAMCDSAGEERLSIGLLEEEGAPRVTMWDSAGKGRLNMGVDEDDPFLQLIRSQDRVWSAP